MSPWLHAKLALVIALSGVHGYLAAAGADLRRGSQSPVGAVLSRPQRGSDGSDDADRRSGRAEAFLGARDGVWRKRPLKDSPKPIKQGPSPSAGASQGERISAIRAGFSRPRQAAASSRFRLSAFHSFADAPRRERVQGRPDAGNQTQGPQEEIADRAARLRRGERGRERLDHAQAGADVRDSQAVGEPRGRDHRRGRGRDPAGRFRVPALGRRQLPRRARRHLRFAVANSAAGPAHRRHGRGRDPQPEGRRTLFRAAQVQRDQFRGPGEDAPQGAFRQSDAALSRRAAAARGRGSDAQGPVGRGSSTSSRRSARASAR